jgi:hypothetical protein
VRDGIDQVQDAFLARDPADEEDVRAPGIYGVAVEMLPATYRPVLVGVDAIPDDVDLLRATLK